MIAMKPPIRLRHKLLSVGSIAASAAIYALLWPPRTLVGIPVLVAHEAGHYTAARNYGAQEVLPPVFISVGIFSVGFTYIKNPVNKRVTAIAGPLCGLTTIGIIGLHALLFGVLQSLALTLILVTISEIYSLTLGSDARQFRKAK